MVGSAYAYPFCPVVHPNWPVVFAIIGEPRGIPGAVPDCPAGKPDGPTVFRGTDLPSRVGDGGTCPRYEFIGIPYNGWGCESPFVTDVLDIDIMLLVSYDGKLAATDFSNVRVNFLIDSSNPPICCFT
jgi:hypothetical protein